MQDPEVSATVMRFDVFEIDLRAGELRKKGRRVKLQEQPLRVLSLLIERSGDVVTREELRQSLWPADTFVDFDHGLNSAVARLREALGDSADEPRFIETVAKRGYRLIVPVERPEVASPSIASQAAESLAATVASIPEKTPIGSYPWWKIWITAVVFACLMGAIAMWAVRRRSPESPVALLQVVPLVSLHGFQATPSFSPDGSFVAFRQNDGAHKTGIYTALVGGEKSIQLTSDLGDCCPTWSPDGRQIAFVRYSREALSIYTVSALGGTERRVYRGAKPNGAGLNWSRDGKWLAFPESSAADSPRSWISRLSVSDYSTHPLTSPPGGSIDHEPAFSPDGNRLAFVRSTVAGVSNDVFVMSAKGGEAKRITFDNRPIMGPPTWTEDSQEIVFSSDRGGATALWRISADGGTPHPVAGPVGDAKWPSIPSKGDALVYEQGVSRSNIWRLDQKGPNLHERAAAVAITEKGEKMRPDLSPDGKKIAFESNRLGFWDIWICDTNDKNCEQATSLHGTAGRARWSPNGRYIAFEFHPKERGEIYVVEVPGGVPHYLSTIPGADNLSPSWSRDGKWMYFASKRGDKPFQIWKMPVQGGTPVQVTKNGGISPIESEDGRFLYFSKYEQGGVWRMPLQGGEETEVLEEAGRGGWPNWSLSSDGIYFLSFDKFPRMTIKFYEFATGKSTLIWKLEREPGWGLSTSADGKSIVYVQNEFAESNLMLVSNFR